MRPRLPRIDFSKADGLWIPRWPEMAHRLNGASLFLPYLEPYLIRVMKQARPLLEAKAPSLLPEVDVFNRQEANHYKVHAAYNRILFAQYPGLETFDREIKADFERFLAEESLEWNLAYCEGFECSGLISSEFYLQEIDDALEGADPAVHELWSWHLAEEFEHRSVTHDVLATVAPGWLHRLRGFKAFGVHLQAFTARVSAHLMEIDRERGRIDDTSDADRAAFARREARFYRPRILKILTPWYSPHPRPIQTPTRRVLDAYPD
ncbi:MAG: metal-dependent hydrolase [Myxococcota bacterium]